MADYPILLERAVLDEHAWFLGDSGSGKTALGIAPLVSQLIGSGDSSVVVLDLKGDPGDLSLFEECRGSADRKGIRFRWFSNEPGRSSHVFNPLAQDSFKSLGLMGKVEVLARAFGLDHGEGYGKSYFSRVARRVLQRLFKERPDIGSFEELSRLMRPEELKTLDLTPEDLSHAGELAAVVESLAYVEPLNADGPERALEERIQMHQPFAAPEVMYFALSSATQSATVREVARLALFSLLSAAAQLPERKSRVYLVIDEFQRIATSSIDIVLQQARSMGVSVILANQAYSDLKSGGDELAAVVQANTRFKLAFASSDRAQREDIAEMSGEAMYELHSESVSTSDKGGSYSFTEKEEIGPRLRKNDIIEATADSKLCIAHATRDHGVTAFGGFSFIMRVDFHISEWEYRRRAKIGWPEATEATICSKANESETPPLPKRRNSLLTD